MRHPSLRTVCVSSLGLQINCFNLSLVWILLSLFCGFFFLLACMNKSDAGANYENDDKTYAYTNYN